MTKDEAKLKLRKEGYNVVDDNSVVTVLISADMSVSKTVKEVESKLKAFGYEASFAVKQVSDGFAPEIDETPDIEDAGFDFETAEAGDTVSGSEVQETAGDHKPGDESGEGDSDDVYNGDTADSGNETEVEYFDDDDSDMLLTEDAVQFSLDDFGLDF